MFFNYFPPIINDMKIIQVKIYSEFHSAYLLETALKLLELHKFKQMIMFYSMI